MENWEGGKHKSHILNCDFLTSNSRKSSGFQWKHCCFSPFKNNKSERLPTSDSEMEDSDKERVTPLCFYKWKWGGKPFESRIPGLLYRGIYVAFYKGKSINMFRMWLGNYMLAKIAESQIQSVVCLHVSNAVFNDTITEGFLHIFIFLSRHTEPIVDTSHP